MSTLKVNTIQGLDGDGITAKVTTEGGAATTGLVQGLTKTWICLGTDSGNAINRDSFNVSSIDDDGTGLFTVHHANNFVATFYSKTTAPFGTVGTGNQVGIVQYQDHSASQSELNVIDEENAAYDMTSLGFQAAGDLA